MTDALLTRTAEYALRAMACVAGVVDPPVRAVDIAACSGVPRSYLSKILRQLVVAGLLNSRKGHHGGFTLARPATRISLLDVLVAVDADPLAERCAFGWGLCDAADPCAVHGVWDRLREQFRSWAQQHSLADLDLDRLETE